MGTASAQLSLRHQCSIAGSCLFVILQTQTATVLLKDLEGKTLNWPLWGNWWVIAANRITQYESVRITAIKLVYTQTIRILIFKGMSYFFQTINLDVASQPRVSWKRGLRFSPTFLSSLQSPLLLLLLPMCIMSSIQWLLTFKTIDLHRLTRITASQFGGRARCVCVCAHAWTGAKVTCLTHTSASGDPQPPACVCSDLPTSSLPNSLSEWGQLTGFDMCVCVCVCVPVPVPVSTLFNVSTSCPVVPQTVLQFKVTTHLSSRVVDLDLLDFIPRLLSIGSNTSDPHVLFQHRADFDLSQPAAG